MLESMGRRLADYLAATSPLPDLDEAWCNAAYWYHEALAESLDTVAVPKLETAIEVLFRAESMSGSKQRMLDCFDAIFGLKGNDGPHRRDTIQLRGVYLHSLYQRSFASTDMRPFPHADGFDDLRRCGEFVPRLAGGCDDSLVAVEDAVLGSCSDNRDQLSGCIDRPYLNSVSWPRTTLRTVARDMKPTTSPSRPISSIRQNRILGFWESCLQSAGIVDLPI